MRKAAGILMVVLGLTMMWVYVDALGRDDVYFMLSVGMMFILCFHLPYSSLFRLYLSLLVGSFVLRESIG